MEQREINLKDLPKEIFVEIFKFLSVKDLLSLTLTSKVFNDIISNTTDLCGRFKVLLTRRYRNKKWIGRRKYENFKIYLCHHEELTGFLKIFMQCGRNVKSLEIIENCFKVETLRTLFCLCPNVKYIYFSKNHPNQVAEDGVLLPRLQCFEYEGESLCIGNFFKCRDLKAVSLSGSYSWPDILLERFLVKQKNLTSLRLKNFDKSGFIFTSPVLSDKIKFRLNSLSLMNMSTPQHPGIFRDFLSIHKNSLQQLEIGNFQYGMLRHFIDFSNLKTLKIVSQIDRPEINIDNFYIQPMEQIEHLIIDNQNVTNFATKFPNLITLETRKLRLKSMEINQLKKLQKLTVVESKRISKISLPNCRELRFVSCTFNGGKILTSHQDSIEILSIKDCKNVEWLTDLFRRENLRLKHLEIIGMKMSSELYHDILAMGTKKVDKLIFSSNKVVNKLEIFKQSFSSFFRTFVDCIACEN